ncbi:MAG: OmpA/MotB domain protein [Ignavibacteria bacterium]|nr:OmpA/MotB domain protein [Ignavibacteria bacterium]
MRVWVLFLIFSIGKIFSQSALIQPQADSLSSQLPPKYKLGIYAGGNYNSHNALFQKLPGIPNCCPRFEAGSGIGNNFGLLFEYKLSSDFWLGSRFGAMTFNGELKKDEATTIKLNNQITTGTFEHKLESKYMNIGFEPALIYMPIDKLLLSVGLRLGKNITSTYKQIETITQPPGIGTFLDSLGNDSHSRSRNAYSGNLPKAIPYQFGIFAGVSYELPLNKRGSLRLAPEVMYYLPLTELVENTDWKVSSIRAGIALKYYPLPKPPKIPVFQKKYRIDTVVQQSDIFTEDRIITGKERTASNIEETEDEIITTQTISRTDTLFKEKRYFLDGSISAVGIDSLGNEVPNTVFKIDEYISNRLDPLLNYIFFDNNAAALPERYLKIAQNQTSEFEIDSLYRDNTLEIYYHILNIVGKRLNQNPTANLVLTGCNSDYGDEKGNSGLSQKRAETVRDYLTGIWKISSDRVKLETRNLPQKASTPKDEPDKIAENRRVEMYSAHEKILEPVFIRKFDRKSNPPSIRIKPKVKSETGLKSWTISGFQRADTNNKFKASGKEKLDDYVDWELEKFQKIFPKAPEPVIVSLLLEDVKGNKKEIENQTLPIEVVTIWKKKAERIGDYEIERFSLILFDFSQATIEGRNSNIIDFINDRIKPESLIEIKGFADRTGNADFNRKLADKRAQAAKSELKRKDASAGVPENMQLLFDNEYPEGRFYCRTVLINVKTPIKFR